MTGRAQVWWYLFFFASHRSMRLTLVRMRWRCSASPRPHGSCFAGSKRVGPWTPFSTRSRRRSSMRIAFCRWGWARASFPGLPRCGRGAMGALRGDWWGSAPCMSRLACSAWRCSRNSKRFMPRASWAGVTHWGLLSSIRLPKVRKALMLALGAASILVGGGLAVTSHGNEDWRAALGYVRKEIGSAPVLVRSSFLHAERQLRPGL